MRLWVPLVVACALLVLHTSVRDSGGVVPEQVEEPSVRFELLAQEAPEDPLIAPIEFDKSIDSAPPLPNDVFAHDDRATFHPHGDRVCASGCAASRHPTEGLTNARFRKLLAEYSIEPLHEPGVALETLLYYGRQAATLLDSEGTGPLDGLRAALLKRELARQQAEVEIRVLDARGRVRASLPLTKVPLDRRHEFELDTHNLQPLVASGTVKRVGLDYLWMRL
jgi:hypothetical protein